MGKWDLIVLPLLEFLESDSADERGLRERVDDKIWGDEKDAENSFEPSRLDEKPEDCSREFRAALRAELKGRLEQDPQNRILQEALKLLDQPRLRHPDHRPRDAD